MAVQSRLNWVANTSNELWCSIFDFLSAKDLRETALVCRTFGSITSPLKFRTAVFRMNRSYTEEGYDLDDDMTACNHRCNEHIMHVASKKSQIKWRVKGVVVAEYQGKHLCGPSADSFIPKSHSMELLLRRVHFLNLTYLEFRDFPVSFALAREVCGGPTLDRPPLQELCLLSEIEDDFDYYDQLRARKVYISGDLGEYLEDFGCLIHPIITATLTLDVSHRWDNLLFLDMPPLHALTELVVEAQSIRATKAVAAEFVVELLGCCPELKVAHLYAVKYDASETPIIGQNSCPALDTLAAPLHIACALLPGRRIRRLCLVGVPVYEEEDVNEENSDDDDDNDDPHMLFSWDTEFFVNDADLIQTWIKRSGTHPSVHELQLLARSVSKQLLVQIWLAFPNLRILDIRIVPKSDYVYPSKLADIVPGFTVDSDESDDSDISDYSAPFHVLWLSKSVFPLSLERFTLCGLKLDKRSVKCLRLAIEDLAPPHLRLVEFASLNPQCTFLWSRADDTMDSELKKTPVEEWVPYAHGVNEVLEELSCIRSKREQLCSKLD